MSPIHNFYHAQLFAQAVSSGDTYSIALFHFEGTQGQQTFTDDSTYARGVTGNNGAHISTTQSKFGSSSLKLDGLGGTSNQFSTRDLLSLSDNAVWSFLTQSFTIDWWAYHPTANQGQMIFGQFENSTNWYGCYSGANSNGTSQTFGFGALTGGSWDINISATTSVPQNTWTHFAVVRDSYATGSGTWLLYVNGVSQKITLNVGSLTGQVRNYAGPAMVGSLLGNYASDMAGYIDELRVSRNIARWITPTFSVPTSPYT